MPKDYYNKDRKTVEQLEKVKGSTPKSKSREEVLNAEKRAIEKVREFFRRAKEYVEKGI